MPALLGHFSFHTVSPRLLLPEQPCSRSACVPGGLSSDLHVSPGPRSFCSSLLSQFLDFLLLTFSLSFAKCKLYDHITPLLKLFVWFPIVLRVEPTDLQSWLPGVCAVTVVFLFDFCFLQSCPCPVLRCTNYLRFSHSAFHASVRTCCGLHRCFIPTVTCERSTFSASSPALQTDSQLTSWLLLTSLFSA